MCRKFFIDTDFGLTESDYWNYSKLPKSKNLTKVLILDLPDSIFRSFVSPTGDNLIPDCFHLSISNEEVSNLVLLRDLF